MARTADLEQRLDFIFGIETDEFILRFDSRPLAIEYQKANHEARILEGHPYDVWLPLPLEMTRLRSSSVGMAVSFPSMEDAGDWQKRTFLGTTVTLSDRSAAVYFKREWAPGEMRTRLKSQKPGPRSSNPSTRELKKAVKVNVATQNASAKTDTKRRWDKKS